MASLAEVLAVLDEISNELGGVHRGLSLGQGHANRVAQLATQLQGSASAELVQQVEAVGQMIAATAQELANQAASMHESVNTYRAAIQG